MKVLIVEDNKIHLETIVNKLLGIKINLNIDFDIIIPQDYQEVLHINTNTEGVINIIDIINNEDDTFNGVNLAEDIRNLTRNSYIVFITSYKQYLDSAVNKNVEPLAYISKNDPNLEVLLLNAFKRVLYTKSHFEDITKVEFIDKYNDRLFISLNDILLLRTHPDRQKYLILETNSKAYIVKGKINQFVSKHHNLIICNKSTIINKQKIKKIIKGTNSKNKIIVLEHSSNKVLPDIILSGLYKQNLI